MVLPTISVTDGSTATPAAGTTPVASTSAGNAISISIATPGTFETITTFIADLEKDIRFMNIQAVSIGNGEDASGKSTMSVSLQIEAYKRGAAAVATSATAATTTPATAQ
jgi:Tfp pilus assembly protein PilO